MTSPTKTPLGISFEQFRELPRDRATALIRDMGADLLRFLARGEPAVDAAEPARSRNLAQAFEKVLVDALQASETQASHIRDRILIDGFLRSELDCDQNVYMGPFFTRVLTRALPDLVFQPATPREVELAIQWARESRVGLATRGAGSAAMGGAVSNNGGLLLEMSRFDQVQGDRADTVAVIGAGARLKTIHNRLAEMGLALKTYPSNLGGTFAGWFSTGGLGLNSFKYGPVQEQVRAVSAILPRGEHVRFHDDGRLDVLEAESANQRLTPEDAEEWLVNQGYPPLRLHDLAGTEGQFGILLTFTVDVIPLPRLHPHFFEFTSEVEALHFVQWVSDTARSRRCPPANLKYLSASHVAAARTVRNGVKTTGKPAVYIDFDDAEEASQFEAGLASGKWTVQGDAAEALAWHDDRFRPQQTKRLGPGYLAAEILMPTQHVERFLDRAAQLTSRVGVHLESEVYFLDEGRSLVIAGYMTQGRRRGFVFEMALAPMLVDLAMRRYDGFPYVLGRWQSPFFKKKYGSGGARTLRRMKKRADKRRTLNPGVFFAPAFRVPGVAGFYKVGFPMGLRILRGLYSTAGFSQMFRRIIGNAPRQRLLHTPGGDAKSMDVGAVPVARLEDLAEHSEACVNCGECNSVCPIYHDAGIRLPQMLTHIGAGLQSGDAIEGTPQLLLDLCMRCGNCQEVCQADIPHLGLYAQMEVLAGDIHGERRERHAAILTQLRHSERYLRDFLNVRPGYYLSRTPASLPGEVRFVLFRAENDEGADVSCLHCGACVPVCPTNANHEYEVETDLRRISTDWSRCVGCGTCVEVCPANQVNGGRTLRVMEAPTRDFFDIVKQVEAASKPQPVGESCMSTQTSAMMVQPQLMQRLRAWEEVLSLVVDPGRSSRDSAGHQLLQQLLRQADLDVEAFWSLSPSRRSRQFLETYSRSSRDLRRIEVSSFDLDRVSKERYRSEPLTVGAAWHHGYWRSYFSHAAITHPANDGLREEFSTAWDILRRQPAVVQRTENGRQVHEAPAIQLDMPILVGPLPHSDGLVLERAYLDAIATRDPQHDLRIKTLVIVDSATYRCQESFYAQHHESLLVRVPAEELLANSVTQEAGGWALVRDIAPHTAMVEIDVPVDLAVEALLGIVQRLAQEHPQLLVSMHLHYEATPADGDASTAAFWKQLHAVAHEENVAMLHVHSGEERSYRLIPRIDELLKKARLRSRLQLVTAGGTHDAVASASAVYEAILLGANGGSISLLAEFALSSDFADVVRGDDPKPVVQALSEKEPFELAELAQSTLTCWQHSILDFLSCMGIDDIQKTSGNTMAITMTEDWVREVDALATREFGERNREQNKRRIEHEPIPAAVRADFRVSRLLGEVDPEVDLVLAAKLLAQRNANYHLMNTNKGLSADHLEVIYQMAAGRFPEVGDFFLDGPLGEWSMDAVGVRLSRRHIDASLQALRKNPAALDYINMCVPRGFQRQGAAQSHAQCLLALDRGGASVLHTFRADAHGGFEESIAGLETASSLWLLQKNARGQVESTVELQAVPKRQAADRRPAGAPAGLSVRFASADHRVVVKATPAADRWLLVGTGYREPLFSGPVNHASISLGAAGEDFLLARVEGNAGLAITSSGEGGPLRLPDEVMRWESLQAASGHFGLTGTDLRRVRDVEIKINQGAKPGKGGRLAGHKVTPTVSRARNIPVGTNALSPDPKHDIYSIEDMPAEVWLWMQYGVHCGIKITGSSYTRYVAAGMWSNFVVDYLLVDAGLGGSGNYHADSSRVGWPDIFRTILHTHHALMDEPLFDADTGETHTIRDLNGKEFGANGGTKLLASGGIRSEMDMLKVLLAGADGLLEASIGKAVAFGCNQCGNCHIDCPRGGITTKVELTLQNDRRTMAKRFRNWTALNMVKLAVLIDAINRELGYVNKRGQIVDDREIFDDIRKLRGRTDLLSMPKHPAAQPAIEVPDLSELQAELAALQQPTTAPASVDVPEQVIGLPESPPPEVEHDSCRVGSLLVSEPVDVEAIWESARLSMNGGNNRGGGIAFGGFAPEALRNRTCIMFNTIGPDRAETMERMLDHLEGLRLFDAQGSELDLSEVLLRLPEFRVPVRPAYQGEEGWRRAGLLEDVGDVSVLFTELRGDALWRFGRQLLGSRRWVQRQLKYGHMSDGELETIIDEAVRFEEPFETHERSAEAMAFLRDVKEEYYMTLAHILDTRYYRTGGVIGKYSDKRRGFVVSMGEDMGAIKISGWTHLIPAYFDLAHFWAAYPGAREEGGIRRRVKGEDTWTTALLAHVWGMHHRYPTNSPAMDADGRGNPAGAHPFKAYNVLLMHNGEQVGVDSTAPMLMEHCWVHTDESMGPGHEQYVGDSLYERKALTDTEYAAYLVDFTRRVLGLPTDDATQVISPITGIDLEAVEPAERRERYRVLSRNYVQLTPTGPYKFTIVETRQTPDGPRVGFRENMDIKFLRPHEIAINWDTGSEGVKAIANGSEAKIADSMLGVLRQQGVLADAGSDLRFNMRPGGRPNSGEMGGVFEVFVDAHERAVSLRNRFGEDVTVPRAGRKPAALRGLKTAVAGARKPTADEITERLQRLQDNGLQASEARREFTDWSLSRVRGWDFDEFRYLTEWALPRFALESDGHREAAIDILTELRKRLQFCDTAGKSLAALQYFTDGGFEYDGEAEGGLYRLFASVPHLWQTQGQARYSRIDFDTRLDLMAPRDRSSILVADMHGFRSEAFGLEGAAHFVGEAVRQGWRHLITYNHRGGPRYVGTNLATPENDVVRDALIEVYGTQSGDFLGALLEGSEVRCYGQGQSHVGMKMDQGSIFVLHDILNTGLYAAHGGHLSVWDSGSRFAVAGQNRVYEEDGTTLAQGLQSIHFGSPNEYAFEYLMSGGENSLHVVMGLEKPDGRGQLCLRPRPYAGKFFMSGAAAGRVFVFDPEKRLVAAQVHGNEATPVSVAEWDQEVGPLVARTAAERGLPIEVKPGGMRIQLDGTWREYGCHEAFTRYQPITVPRSVQRQGIAPPALVNMVPE